MKKEIGYDSLPEAYTFKLIKSPKLVGGTEEEIKKATKNRNETCKNLLIYVMRYTSDGKPSILYRMASQGTEDVKQIIQRSISAVDETGVEIKIQKLAEEIEAYNDLAKRIERFNEIASNERAEYWITGEKIEQLKKKIDGKL